MDDQTRTELEFIVREYAVVTEQLCAAFMKVGDEIPLPVLAALDQLASAVEVCWGE